MGSTANPLEDAFWTARAKGLADQAGTRGRTAILVRRGRVVIEHTESKSHPESRWQALLDRQGGGTLYLSFVPSSALIDASLRARLARIVAPDLTIDLLVPFPLSLLTRTAF